MITNGRLSDCSYIVFCDRCGNSLKSDYLTYIDARNDFKDHGWKHVRHKNGKWKNYCPQCNEQLHSKERIKQIILALNNKSLSWSDVGSDIYIEDVGGLLNA